MKRFYSRAARTAAIAPIKLLPADLRAVAIERLNDDMVKRTRIPGGSIKFYAPTPLLRSRAETVLSKEVDTIRWIDGFKKGDVFWDIGANVGVFSLYASARHELIVLAFEPSAANFYVLSRNIQLNHVAHLINAYCIAFADRTHLGFLNLATENMGGALNQFGNFGEMSPYITDGSHGLAHGMIGFSIDGFIEIFNPPFPTHLKLDVDGLELAILAGARDTLKNPQLRSVLAELSLSRTSELNAALQLFEQAGLQLVGKGEPQGSDPEIGANHLFERAT
jgi:FkbM family methyltransferase